jgi:hypothetical protein
MQLPRQEWWHRLYHVRPYLRPLSDDELLAIGAVILRRVMPHFLEEMNFHELDVRRI